MQEEFDPAAGHFGQADALASSCETPYLSPAEI